MSFRIERPTHPLDTPRESWPSCTIEQTDNETILTLHKGEGCTVDISNTTPLVPAEALVEETGIRADLLLKLKLGRTGRLYLLDRGEDTQGLERNLLEPLVPVDTARKALTISDRFLVVTRRFLIAASIRTGFGQQMKPGTPGILEMCAGSSAVFGLDHDCDGRLPLPDDDSISKKHAAIAFDLGPKLVYVNDCNATNPTEVVLGRH